MKNQPRRLYDAAALRRCTTSQEVIELTEANYAACEADQESAHVWDIVLTTLAVIAIVFMSMGAVIYAVANF